MSLRRSLRAANMPPTPSRPSTAVGHSGELVQALPPGSTITIGPPLGLALPPGEDVPDPEPDPADIVVKSMLAAWAAGPLQSAVNKIKAGIAKLKLFMDGTSAEDLSPKLTPTSTDLCWVEKGTHT